MRRFWNSIVSRRVVRNQVSRNKLTRAACGVIEPLEVRQLLSAALVNGTAGNDTIIARLRPTDVALFEVLVNGAVNFVDTASSVTSLQINGNNGNDTINVIVAGNFSNDIPVTVNGGEGNDTISFGNASFDLDASDGATTVDGGAGTGSVILTDTDSGSQTYTLDSGTFDRLSYDLLSYVGLESLELRASNQADVVNILGTITGMSLNIKGNGGLDTFNVGDGDIDTNTDDAMTLNGGGGADVLKFLDSADAGNGDDYTLTKTTFTKTGTGVTTFAAFEGIELSLPLGNETVFLQGVNAGTPVTVLGNDGDDTLSVGTGNMTTQISAAVTFDGGLGNDVLSVNDTNAVGGGNYTLNAATLSRAGTPVINHVSVAEFKLFTGTGADTVSVNALPSGGVANINTGAGNDTLNVGGGDIDTNISLGTVHFNGDVGTDRLILNDAADGVGNDSHNFTGLSYNKPVGFSTVTFSNNERIDLNTGEFNDTINASALSIPISVNSGLGDDSIFTGSGNDTINSGGGADSVFAGDGNDSVLAGAGNDIVGGQIGNDTLKGEGGNDLIQGGLDNDSIDGGVGADALYGDIGDDTLAGGDGNDTLYGDKGDDSLVGNAGNDALVGDNGNDTAVGGTGNDEYYFGGVFGGGFDNDVISEVAGQGNDLLTFTFLGSNAVINLTSNTIAFHLARGITTPAGQFSNFERATGGAGNDSITGNDAANTLIGGSGNDTLIGNNGADRLEGGFGNDSLIGGGGADLMLGEDGVDTLFGGGDGVSDTLNGGAGADVLGSSDGVDVLNSVP